MRDGYRVPLPVRTERLLLRLLTARDADALLAYRSREDVCRYLPFPPMDRAEIDRRLALQWGNTRLEQDGDALTLGVEVRATGELVGDVVLFVHNRADHGGEVGWVLHPAASGNGYATEAARALLGIAFDGVGLHRVVAQMHPDNTASGRVAGRLGMRREALLLRDALVKGMWEDTLIHALLEDEWRDQTANT